MFTPTVIDATLNRLSRHFGSHLVVRPPATAADLANLEAMVGPLPRDIMILLATCDGFRIESDRPQAETHLWHVREMISAMAAPAAPIPDGFLPIRGDVTGERDYLILSNCPLHGVVLRWEYWCEGHELIASSFGRYFEAWSRYLLENFDRTGQPNESPLAVTFDSTLTRRWDPELQALTENPDIDCWLTQLDNAVPSGAEFE